MRMEMKTSKANRFEENLIKTDLRNWFSADVQLQTAAAVRAISVEVQRALKIQED